VVFIVSILPFFKEKPSIEDFDDNSAFDFFISTVPVTKDVNYLSMEHDLLPYLATHNMAFTYPYQGFWRSIKNAGSAVYCNSWKLNDFSKKRPEALTSNVDYEISLSYVHPTAVISPTAKIGPNVYIGPSVVVHEGARISNSIILNEVVIQKHSCILYSIISERSSVGPWTRLEGIPHNEDLRFALSDERYERFGITVLGSDVDVGPELIVRNCIVMPNKEMTRNYFNEIVL